MFLNTKYCTKGFTLDADGRCKALLFMCDVRHGASPHEVPLGVRHRHHGPHHGAPVVVLEARHGGDGAGVDPGAGHALGGGQGDAAAVVVVLAEAEVWGLDVDQLGLVWRQHLGPLSADNSAAVVLAMMGLMLAVGAAALLRCVREV